VSLAGVSAPLNWVDRQLRPKKEKNSEKIKQVAKTEIYSNDLKAAIQ
jgi:hypothetical protein